ncbi:motilin-like [Melanotaenia boesemani]|uniref:motilin-like n=1 Tax=Melanotaenia boesemani TaxID=1250792 RepID=UPI001C03DA8F|nr:motilin-like [Melanotaenia boesemani]XP_041836237.1 motilin-like [Melanotaenia boesemani]
MSMRGAVAGCVVLTCLLALLAERTDGHITFFSPKEMMLMKEREGKKDIEPRSEDGQFEEVAIQQVPQMEHNGNPDKTLEIAVRLSPKQRNHVAPMLEEFIHEIVEDNQKAK